MKQKISGFLRDECGATAIEYGLIAALVSVAGIASLTQMGNSLATIFETVGTIITTAALAANGSS